MDPGARVMSTARGRLRAVVFLGTAGLCAGYLAAVPLGAPQATAVPDRPCAVGSGVVPPPPSGLRISSPDRPTGKGVRVAVIDTGVANHPRLGGVDPGADLVDPEDPEPLHDCDGHGTIVAGVIAARGAPGDEVEGVAPGAHIISIRQTSGHHRGASGAESSGTLVSLAEAIDAGVDAGARVLNISVVSCVDPAQAAELDSGRLEAALRRAETAGAIVVAAAGNVSQQCAAGATVYPAVFPTVLTVAALEDEYHLADYSLPTASESLAASGTVAAGLDPGGSGLIDAVVDPVSGERRVLRGTSFAAPVISGIAALLIERYPEETSTQIRERIQHAAEPPNGVVDVDRVVGDLAAGEARQVSSVPEAITLAAANPEARPARAGFLGALLTTFGVAAAFFAGVVLRGPRRK